MTEIHEKIKLKEDCRSYAEARRLAVKFIKKEGFPLDNIKGMIYIVGPTISDLIIVEPLGKVHKKNPQPKLRQCTDEEWNRYFWTHLHSRE